LLRLPGHRRQGGGPVERRRRGWRRIARCPSRRTAVLVALVTAGVANAAPRCGAGTFVIHGGPRLLARGAGTLDVVLVSAGPPPSVSLAGACAPARLEGHGARIAATWKHDACSDERRVRLRAAFDAGCQTLRGLMRAAGARAVRFAAVRCADD